MQDVQQLISRLGLLPHPEGGYYRETHRSAQRVTTATGERSASTAIYYLLRAGEHSAWHRIDSDELWHFYAGWPLDIHILDRAGILSTRLLGNPLTHPGSAFQVRVPAGQWFAAELSRTGPDAGRADQFALAGCTVAPGFEFSRFELADTQALCRQYPQHAALWERLSPAVVTERKDRVPGSGVNLAGRLQEAASHR